MHAFLLLKSPIYRVTIQNTNRCIMASALFLEILSIEELSLVYLKSCYQSLILRNFPTHKSCSPSTDLFLASSHIWISRH